MIVWVDVLDTEGDVIGDGPIQLISATATRLIDGSGGIKLDCPADARGRELLTPGRYFKVWYETQDENVLLAEGIIKKSGLNNGRLSMDCNDLMEELKYQSTLLNYQINGDTVQVGISGLISALGWTVEASGTATTATVVQQFDGDTILKALLSLAESAGVHVRLRVGRVLQVGDFGVSNGVALFDATSGAGGDATSGVIESLTIEDQGDQLANRILPVGGAFSGGANVTLASATRSGITILTGHDGNPNYCVDDAESIALYGLRVLYKTYPDLKPLAAGAPAEIACANQIYDAAVADLAKLSVIRRNFKGKVRGLTTLLLPGDLVQVFYNEPIYQDDGSLWPGGAIDESLYINRAETYAGEGGWWQNLDMSNVNAQRVDEATDVAISVERSKKA